MYKIYTRAYEGAPAQLQHEHAEDDADLILALRWFAKKNYKTALQEADGVFSICYVNNMRKEAAGG